MGASGSRGIGDGGGAGLCDGDDVEWNRELVGHHLGYFGAYSLTKIIRKEGERGRERRRERGEGGREGREGRERVREVPDQSHIRCE